MMKFVFRSQLLLILLGIQLNQSCGQTAISEINPLKFLDIVDSAEQQVTGKKISRLSRFYLVNLKGSNKSKAMHIYKYLESDGVLKKEIKKFTTVELLFFSVSDKTNLTTIKENPLIITSIENPDQICDFLWTSGKLNVIWYYDKGNMKKLPVENSFLN